MRFRKLIALFLSIIMLMSFSTMFVSANTRSINYPQSWVNVGETIQLSISGNASATWSSSNSAIATVSSSGKVTGVSRGNVTITATCPDYNGSTETFYTYIDVYDNRGIVNGEEYYIMNTLTHQVLSLASSSTANNTEIITSSRGTSTTKQWKLTQQADGKYTFVSMYNSTTKGMYANTSTNDVYLYTVGSSATHFEIERVNSGTYQGTYRIRYNGKYLAANASNDVYLTSTLDYRCYWSLSRVDKSPAEMYCQNYYYYTEDGDREHYDSETANSGNFQRVFSGLGYIASVNVTDEDTLIDDIYNNMKNNDSVFVFRGHGSPGGIFFHIDEEVEIGAITVHPVVLGPPLNTKYISSCTTNELSNLRCVLYLGCSTAVYTEGTAICYNLVDMTYEKGAHFVLGTTEDMYTHNNDAWLRYFLEKIESGGSILNAILHANSKLGPIKCPYKKSDNTKAEKEVDEFPAYYMGDTYQYFN